MADISEWTTTEAVRAALGVDDTEVSDAFLLDQNMNLQLDHDLDQWYADRSALTEIQERGLRLYSMWFCATLVADMWLALPQRISDGKVDLRRFTELDLAELQARAAQKRDYYKGLLDPAPAATNLYPHVAAASPDYDPVSNTET